MPQKHSVSNNRFYELLLKIHNQYFPDDQLIGMINSDLPSVLGEYDRVFKYFLFCFCLFIVGMRWINAFFIMTGTLLIMAVFTAHNLKLKAWN